MTKQANIQRKVKTSKIENSRYSVLQESGYTADSIYDKGQYEDIKKTLLDIGGEAVVILPDEHKEAVETRGKSFVRPKIKMKRGFVSQCHLNSASLWIKNIFKRRLFTGYGLSEDGVWRQHSWVMEGSTVIETTEERIVYYGFQLSKEEAMEFYRQNVLVDTNMSNPEDISEVDEDEDFIWNLVEYFERGFQNLVGNSVCKCGLNHNC